MIGWAVLSLIWCFDVFSRIHGSLSTQTLNFSHNLKFSNSKSNTNSQLVFFLSECCMAQRRSLCGRSPFCQRKQSKCRNFTGSLFFHESNKPKTKHETKHQPRCSLPESAGAVGCGLFLGRLDQGLVGNAESTHVNRPKGKATFVP